MKKSVIIAGAQENNTIISDVYDRAYNIADLNHQVTTRFQIFVSTDDLEFKSVDWLELLKVSTNSKEVKSRGELPKDFLKSLPYQSIIIVKTKTLQHTGSLKVQAICKEYAHYQLNKPFGVRHVFTMSLKKDVEYTQKNHTRSAISFQNVNNWFVRHIEIYDKDFAQEQVFVIEKIKDSKKVNGQFLPIMIGRTIYVHETLCTNGIMSYKSYKQIVK